MIFNLFDAEAILKIPLSRRQVQDKMVWMHCRNGKYTVKSGYHVARMLAGDNNGREESSEQKANHQVWNRLWQLRVPSKIKVFGWRACLNILPSKVNLVRRQILKEDRCGLCQRCLESVIHALWECSAAQDVCAGSTA
uniref:Reverse transcriptase zinc-binding domain-containing protein n=1 Tax=Quercus lobata TaxID=97700 RepID=A0A7N2L4E8_QUELO